MKRIPGVVVAIVEDLSDPQEEGRIKVSFPWLEGEPQSTWAPLAVPMAGGSRGAYFMPEVGDEALVSFEQGDFDHPFIVGFLWNGADQPPSSDINPSVRRVRTVSGHELEFDDNTGQERMLLKTQGGHEIEMDDSVPASITIKTNGGQEVTLNDLPGGLTLETAGGNKIAITDAPPGISISVPSGTITVNCLQASVNASSLLNVNAPVAQFTGVVQASSIVAASYTPAPGNTFGL